MASFARYGVQRQTVSITSVDLAIEQLGLVGFAVIDGGYTSDEIDAFCSAFDRAYHAMEHQHGGRAQLEAIHERNTIRLPMSYERSLADLATNAVVLDICRRMIGPYIVLNQQNGVINPARGAGYSQAAFHRDLPYQHLVTSRPLAISALFCLDPFTQENGATFVVPGSHKQEAFPSDAIVESLRVQTIAPAGSFVILDSMVFHSGGTNLTDRDRRGVNHVFTSPLIKPQIDIPSTLGETFTSDSELRTLLGYEVSVPRSVSEYYERRRIKARE